MSHDCPTCAGSFGALVRNLRKNRRKRYPVPPPCPACGQARTWEIEEFGSISALCPCGRRSAFDHLKRSQVEPRKGDI